jgi:hypothetical protein
MTDYNSRSDMMGYAMDELRRHGVPEANVRAAAAHLVGQAEMESSLNPNAVHDNGTGFGIYGAGHERRDAMLGWLRANGYDRNSPEGQMRYMATEAMSGRYPKTRSILLGASPDSLARDSYAITGDFERPAVINDRSRAVLSAYAGDDAKFPMQVPVGNALAGQNGSQNALYGGQSGQNALAYGQNGSQIPMIAALAPPPSLRQQLLGLA